MTTWQINRLYDFDMIEAMTNYAKSVTKDTESIEYANALMTWVNERSDSFKEDWYRENAEQLKYMPYVEP